MYTQYIIKNVDFALFSASPVESLVIYTLLYQSQVLVDQMNLFGPVPTAPEINGAERSIVGAP